VATVSSPLILTTWTQIIVTTPEKWDVITRKTSDAALTEVRLLLTSLAMLTRGDCRLCGC
jgi:hypothetical protein